MSDSNGLMNVKGLWISVVAVLLSFIGGLLTAGYSYGTLASEVRTNRIELERHQSLVGYGSMHEGPDEKRERIERMIALHMAPIQVELREINRSIEELRTALKAQERIGPGEK